MCTMYMQIPAEARRCRLSWSWRIKMGTLCKTGSALKGQVISQALKPFFSLTYLKTNSHSAGQTDLELTVVPRLASSMQ